MIQPMVYPGSEAALGEILWRNNCREQVLIATKLPHYLVKSREGLERLFSPGAAAAEKRIMWIII